jgi:hypothetical protein
MSEQIFGFDEDVEKGSENRGAERKGQQGDAGNDHGCGSGPWPVVAEATGEHEGECGSSRNDEHSSAAQRKCLGRGEQYEREGATAENQK